MKTKEKLTIKGMVCPRCITAVEQMLISLEIPYEKIELGHVVLNNELSIDDKKALEEKLESQGFELLSSVKSQLVSDIKTIIIQQIHHNSQPLAENFSDYISDNLGYDYQHLSRLFSEVEGITINRFIVVQKIERAKELLFYDEHSTAEIADLLGYNSVSYLSSIFKKETGMTISEFKNLKNPARKSIDEI